jgi:hypothetical protein
VGSRTFKLKEIEISAVTDETVISVFSVISRQVFSDQISGTDMTISLFDDNPYEVGHRGSIQHELFLIDLCQEWHGLSSLTQQESHGFLMRVRAGMSGVYRIFRDSICRHHDRKSTGPSPGD